MVRYRRYLHGRLGAAELDETALADETILQLSDRIELIEDDQFSSRFPSRRFARVIFETIDNKRYDSGEIQARWDAADQPSDQELKEKFFWLASEVLPDHRTQVLENMIWQCHDLPNAEGLLDIIIRQD